MFAIVVVLAGALVSFLIPRVGRQNRWLLLGLRALLVLAPLVVAVVLAGKYEEFPSDELKSEWE